MKKLSSNKKRRIVKEIGKCEHCPATENLTIDHKVQRRNGGNNGRANLQVLCEKCHQRKDKHKNKLLSVGTNHKVKIKKIPPIKYRNIIKKPKKRKEFNHKEWLKCMYGIED